MRYLVLTLILLPALVLARPVEVVAIYDGDSFTAKMACNRHVQLLGSVFTWAMQRLKRCRATTAMT